MRRVIRKRITLAHLIVVMILIAAGCLILAISMQQQANALRDDIAVARLEKSNLQREGTAIQQEISISGTDAYIEAKARDTQGYLMPGEIQFVITNPEALYGTGSDIQIEVAGN